MVVEEPAVARKVEEGFGRPQGDTELPIDINYSKLGDWLVDRKQVPADWRKLLQVIHARASAAQREVPPATLAALSVGDSDAALDYFRAVQVRDKLAETAEKNFFGYLTGAAGTWDKICKAYEQGSVFLGEAAQTLQRNTDYEIPFLKKQAAGRNQQLVDLERKEAEYHRSATLASQDYRQECKALGIEGVNLEREVRQLPAQLPNMFRSAVEALQSEATSQALQYYADFAAYAHPSSGSEGGEQQLLPALADVRSGRAPAAASTADVALVEADQRASEAFGIDWGDVPQDTQAADAPVGISWDLDLGEASPADTAAGEQSGGISWDLDLGDAGAADATDAAGEAAPQEISWDIGSVMVEPEDAAEGGAEGDAAPGNLQSKAHEDPDPLEVSWDIDPAAASDAAATEAVESIAKEVAWAAEVASPRAGAGASARSSRDWDASSTVVQARTSSVGTGLSSLGEEAAVGSEAEAAAGVGIQWDVEVGDAGEEAAGEGVSGAAAAAAAAADEQDAGRSGAPSSHGDPVLQALAEDSDFRNRLLDDVTELRAFLLQRKSELGVSGREAMAAAAPEAVQKVLPSGIAEMLAAMEAALGGLTGERVRQLLLVGSSRRYLGRLLRALHQQAGKEVKFKRAAEQVEAKRAEIQQALVADAPKLAALQARTAEVKARVEQVLSEQYGGRRVNIMGEINNLL